MWCYTVEQACTCTGPSFLQPLEKTCVINVLSITRALRHAVLVVWRGVFVAPSAKQSACGCAGVFTAHAALELYAEAFARCGREPGDA